MIVLDTHIWVWWTQDVDQLTPLQIETIEANEADGIGLSTISCWEIAKLVEYGKLDLSVPLEEWFAQALGYPGMELLELTPQVAAASTQLPGQFHRDPADQIIVATARIVGCPLVTSDRKIIQYPFVTTIYQTPPPTA